MANLIADIGNTQTKLAVFNGQEIVFFKHFGSVTAEQLNETARKYNAGKAIISSVKKDHELQLSESIKTYRFNYQMATQIYNHYRTPETLGLDRLAAVVGAVKVHPGKENLVIDAGTCITYDYADAGNNYYGGSISPGVSMRFKAMNYYTAALPLVDKDTGFSGRFGNDTKTAMLSGVQNGIRYEVEGFIKSYLQQQTNINIILTGGDGIFLDTLLKNSIFAPYIKNDPYLVLRGLNAIVQEYND